MDPFERRSLYQLMPNESLPLPGAYSNMYVKPRPLRFQFDYWPL